MVISFKVHKRIREALKRLADKEHRSLSNYILTILLSHLEAKGISWREGGEE